MFDSDEIKMLGTILAVIVLLGALSLRVQDRKWDKTKKEMVSDLVTQETDEDLGEFTVKVEEYMDIINLSIKSKDKIVSKINNMQVLVSPDSDDHGDNQGLVYVSYFDINQFLEDIEDIYPEEINEVSVDIYNLKVREMVDSKKYNIFTSLEVGLDTTIEDWTLEYGEIISRLMGDLPDYNGGGE